MYVVLAIALGGALGSVARHFLSSGIYAFTGSKFPWGILVVNVLGGFIMGLIVELAALKWTFSEGTRAFLTTGVLGGFTTFSTFSLDAVLLIERGEGLAALSYVLLSVVGSIGALFAGLFLVRAL
jgi:CrcB protein